MLPTPAIAVLTIDVVIVVAKYPSVWPLDPVAPMSLEPLLSPFGSFLVLGPTPGIALLPVFVAIDVAKLPCVVLPGPLAPASLVPVVLIGSDRARGQNKRRDQSHRNC